MIGENIKKFRIEKGLTQKDLAEKLFVTAQAVSRWENNEVEPGVETLISISNLLGVTVDELCGKEKPAEPEPIIQKEYVVEKAPEILAICDECKKPIYTSENLVRYTVTKAHHVGRGTRHEKINKVACKDCYKRMQEEKKKKELHELRMRQEEGMKKRTRSYWLSFLLLAAWVGISIPVCINNNHTQSLVLCIISGVLLSLELGCILLNNNFICEMVGTICSWGFVKMPGLIFSLDLDGIIWLLTVKLALWILGICLSIAFTFLGLAIGGACSVFVYPFALAKNYRNPELSAE